MKNKCTCGTNAKHFCNNCSKYKMVFLLKNKFKSEFTAKDLVWYSFLSKDHYSLQRIYSNMLRRYAQSQYCNKVNVIQIRDNKTGNLLQQFKNV